MTDFDLSKPYNPAPDSLGNQVICAPNEVPYTSMPYIRYLVPFLDKTGVASCALISGHEKTLEDPGQSLLNEPSQVQHQLGHDVSIPQSTKELLCVPCKVIDFDRITSLEIKQTSKTSDYRFTQENIFIQLSDLSQPTEKLTCPLCRFFQSVLACSTNVEPGLFQLQAASTRHVFVGMSGEMIEEDKNSVLINVRMEVTEIKYEHGRETTITASPVYVYSQAHQSPLFHVRPLTPEFDVSFAKRCLDYCRKEHGGACNATPASFTNLKVIDCQSKRVVKAEKDCQYVALSYTWGDSPAAAQTQRVLQDVSTAIEDSIEVTLKLGYRYLWVDQFCIDQDDKHERHTQINQMDRIYANAQCTLIAAAGVGQEHGLPGVRNSKRTQKPVLELGQWTLISTVPDLPAAIGRSKWRSRGWTYQEFLLSKRRLVFGEYQSYFICNKMQCTESLVLPPGQIHVDNDNMDRAGISNSSFGYALPGRNPHTIMEYISQFSQRTLSYPADRLHAIEAIFEAFRRGPRPVYNLFGVPIAHPDILRDQGEKDSSEVTHQTSGPRENLDDRYISSGRNAKEGFLLGLTWYRSKPAERVELFPSWSWAGWDGPVEHRSAILDVISSSERFNDVDIYIELDDDRKVDFPDFATLPSFLEQYSEQYKYIHIVAPFLEVTAMECTSPGLFYLEVDLGESKGKKQLRVSLDRIWDNGASVDLSGICFGTTSVSWNFLVLQNMGTHHERCGIATVHEHDKLDFQAVLRDTPKRDIRLA